MNNKLLNQQPPLGKLRALRSKKLSYSKNLDPQIVSKIHFGVDFKKLSFIKIS